MAIPVNGPWQFCLIRLGVLRAADGISDRELDEDQKGETAQRETPAQIMVLFLDGVLLRVDHEAQVLRRRGGGSRKRIA